MPYPCAIEVDYPYKVVEVKGDMVVLDENHRWLEKICIMMSIS